MLAEKIPFPESNSPRQVRQGQFLGRTEEFDLFTLCDHSLPEFARLMAPDYGYAF
jgi:hypothetical protein